MVVLFALGCGATNSQTAPQAPAASSAPAAAPVVPRDLGTLPEGECNVATFLATLGGRCTLVPTSRVSGTGDASQAAAATDHDACTVWSSGGMPPQTVNIDLGAVRDVSGVLLVPDMTPPEGDVTHTLEAVDDLGAIKPVAIVKARMISAHGYAVAFPSPIKARFLRVTTTEATTWVAWREIAPLSCQ